MITIDEVTNNEYMQIFAGSFQIFVRQDFPVFLLATGLYENIDEYEQYLSEYVYDKIWSELSQKDRLVARGIAEVNSGKIKDIRAYLGMETNEFNPYRKRLIKKGIISREMRGYVYFTLPLFDEYVVENYDLMG